MKLLTWAILPVFLGLETGRALAHITPPVILTPEREAIIALLGPVPKAFVREVRLSAQERALIRQQWHWQPSEPFYRFYLGRDRQGKLLAAVIILTEFTMHGPVRVAVGLNPDGTIRGARVIELTEETFYWVQPLLEQHFLQQYVGRASRDSFVLGERFVPASMQSMSRFYGQIIASLMQRAAILFEVTFLRRAQQG